MSQPAYAAPAISAGYARRMSQAHERHVTDRLPIGADGLGIDWPRGFREVPGGSREVRPTAAATPPRPDSETQTSARRPEKEPIAGTTCKARPEASETPGSGAPKLPQPDRPGAGASLPRPLCGQPTERRKRALPEPLRYPFRGTPARIDDPVTSLVLACMCGNLLSPSVTLRRQGLWPRPYPRANGRAYRQVSSCAHSVWRA